MPEERKVATVVFADVVGSTAMGESHDPEVVGRTLGKAYAEMRRILESHGGTVEKFIGDAAMAVFGVPSAHDDDADRAVRAAFAMRRRVLELNAKGRIPLELRIGVNTGEVLAGGEWITGAVAGATVNAAARIQAAAAPGEILAGELTRRLTAGGVRYGAARTVSAKGIGEVPVHPVEDLTSAVPEQHRGIAGMHAPLIGRDRELRILADAYRKAIEERRGSLVTVFGTAGVGKSRLVRELIDTIGTAGVRRGRCLPYGEGITFWPVAEILRADAGITPADPREQAWSKLRGAARQLFTDPADGPDAVTARLAVLAGLAPPEEALADVPGDRLQQELRVALRRYLQRRAEREPLLLVLDDIHWAEPALLDLVAHLAEWSRAPILIACTARPELRERWGRSLPNGADILLEPLSPEDSRRLVADLLDIDALPEALRAQVIARAEGNPLYLEEFLRMLIDAGHIARRDGRWVAEDSVSRLVVSPTLQGLIAARLDEAPAHVKAALQPASVAGRIFWADALEVIAEDVSSGASLTDSVRRELVTELDERGPGGGAAYQFRHVLIRDVAYESLTKAVRMRCHDGFGRWLERVAGERAGEYADIVAYHAEQAFHLADELLEDSATELGRRAIELLLAAGRRAWRRRELRAVATFYGRAAAVIERDAETATAGDAAEARVYAAFARAATEAAAGAVEQLGLAVDAARELGSSRALADGLMALAYFAVRSPDGYARAAALIDEALTVARDIGDHEQVAYVLAGRAQLVSWRGDLAEHRARLEEALEYARAHEARSQLPGILVGLLANTAALGELTRSRGVQAELAQTLASGGSLEDRLYLKMAETRSATWEDRHADAVRAARERVALAEQVGAREELAGAHEHLGAALYWAGDHPASRDELLEALRWVDPATMRPASTEAHRRLARTHLALGDLTAAREHALAARDSVLPGNRASMATTAAALAMVEDAEGHTEEADRLFRESVDAARATPFRLGTTEIEIQYGQFLIDRGRFEEARAMLASAAEKVTDPLAVLPRRLVEEQLRRLDPVVA